MAPALGGGASGARPTPSLVTSSPTSSEPSSSNGPANTGRWCKQVEYAHFCQHPINLSGRVRRPDEAWGEIRDVSTPEDEPTMGRRGPGVRALLLYPQGRRRQHHAGPAQSETRPSSKRRRKSPRVKRQSILGVRSPAA